MYQGGIIMSLSHEIVTLSVGTPAILTTPASTEIDYSRELTISIQNLHSSHFVYLGASNVSTSTYGFRIDPGQTFTATLNPNDEIYAVCDATTTTVGILRIQH
jgi:hypothetical protein